MKKSFKFIALILAVVMLAASLCSCQMLDDAKENRAVYTSPEHTEIEYKGNIYRLLNLGKYDFIDYYYDGSESYYVSDEDVPVLLSGWFGEWMYIDANETHIETHVSISELADLISNAEQYNIYDYAPLNDSAYYVREDQYDAVKEIAETGKFDSYYFDYWAEVDYDNLYWEEYDSLVAGDYHVVKLDAAATQIVDKSLKFANKDKISYKELTTKYVDIIPLGVCDSNKILTNDDVAYCLVQDKDKYYFCDGNYTSENCLVPLNKEDSEIVAKMFDDYRDAIVDDDFSWKFDNDYDYDYEDVDTEDVFI